MKQTRAAESLELYVVNDGKIYKEHTQPAQRALAIDKAKGSYTRATAIRLFGHGVHAALKGYRREFPDGPRPTVSDQRAVASSLADSFEIEYDLGNMGYLLPASKTPAQLDREIGAALAKKRR